MTFFEGLGKSILNIGIAILGYDTPQAEVSASEIFRHHQTSANVDDYQCHNFSRSSRWYRLKNVLELLQHIRHVYKISRLVRIVRKLLLK